MVQAQDFSQAWSISMSLSSSKSQMVWPSGALSMILPSGQSSACGSMVTFGMCVLLNEMKLWSGAILPDTAGAAAGLLLMF
ncbi:hypothetical protein l11_19380 [Neisseria weaveri LMG 5135]|nr:hypothetical protein l11_19380 [Neisseria weaveri LMG 5135]